MAIDLGTLQTQNNGKFVVNLEKGFKVNLEKGGKSLKHLTFSAGWDKASVLPDVDIDIEAIIYENDVLKNMVYYDNKLGVKGMELGKDNRDGSGEGDDEKMKILLDGISDSINRIRLMVSIFKAKEIKNGDSWSFVTIGNGHAGNLQDMVDENENIRK